MKKAKLSMILLFPLLFLFFSAYSFAQSIGITGQFGAMFLISRDTDVWGTKGIVHSGGIISPQHSFRLSEISEKFKDNVIPYEVGLECIYVEMKKVTPAQILTTSSEILSVMASVRIFNNEKFYLICGIGRTWLYVSTSIWAIPGDMTAKDWAFQVGFGKDSIKDLRFEVKYLYGGRNRNTGIILGLGSKLNIFP